MLCFKFSKVWTCTLTSDAEIAVNLVSNRRRIQQCLIATDVEFARRLISAANSRPYWRVLPLEVFLKLWRLVPFLGRLAATILDRRPISVARSREIDRSLSDEAAEPFTHGSSSREVTE
jgi:hypothetical protein